MTDQTKIKLFGRNVLNFNYEEIIRCNHINNNDAVIDYSFHADNIFLF